MNRQPAQSLGYYGKGGASSVLALRRPLAHADEGQRAHRTLTLLRAFQYGHWLAAATRPVF
jgi:hypothetical protein